MAQMIESQQAIEEHQCAVGKMQVIFCIVADILELPHNVVRAESNSSRKERRKPSNVCRLVLLKQFLRDLKDVAAPLFTFASAFQNHFTIGSTKRHVRTRAKKRVTADLLSALDRLK